MRGKAYSLGTSYNYDYLELLFCVDVTFGARGLGMVCLGDAS